MRFVLALLLAPAAPVLPVASPAMAQAAPAAALLQVLDRAFDARIVLHTEAQAQPGFKTNYDRLDDYPGAAASLGEGALPRNILEGRADRYIAAKGR
ncbi:hypothetical protein [Sphingopyxis sp.]|uniref:hypothetical protein n=1 Tax=Sphingopyxis sp. TaxID=1908224 RepID=UPI0035B3EFEF